MPSIDIDSILRKLSGWDLSLIVGGKKFVINEPALASLAMFRKISGGAVEAKEAEAKLRAAVASLLEPPGAAAAGNWSVQQLIAAAIAIVIHVKAAPGKNLSGIVAAVSAAVLSPKAPMPAPAPVADQTPATAQMEAEEQTAQLDDLHGARG
jgi:hypothetical protein